MEAWRVSEKAARLSEIIPYYFAGFFLSCVSMSLAAMLLLGTSWFGYMVVIFYSLYYALFYLLFAVPCQVFMSRRPRRFYLRYLLIYMGASVIGTVLSQIVIFQIDFFYLVSVPSFYLLSCLAGGIYWFWESIFLYKEM